MRARCAQLYLHPVRACVSLHAGLVCEENNENVITIFCQLNSLMELSDFINMQLFSM